MITVVIINMCNYRYVMSWTHDESSLLSLLLDEVVGTQEMIDIRQDYCRLLDCIVSGYMRYTVYFTGSKAEAWIYQEVTKTICMISAKFKWFRHYSK